MCVCRDMRVWGGLWACREVLGQRCLGHLTL